MMSSVDMKSLVGRFCRPTETSCGTVSSSSTFTDSWSYVTQLGAVAGLVASPDTRESSLLS